MQPRTRASKRSWQTLAKIASLILLIVAANIAADWVIDFLKLELRPRNEDAVHQAIMTSSVIYSFLIAIPFVPGVEIGLALIGMIGPGIVLLVYLSTIAGLSISFFIGRFISLEGLIRLLEWLRFARATKLLLTIKPMNVDDRLGFLVSKAPSRFLPFLLRHRYVALAIALNLPGNILIGGGGGLSLMAGVSRLYSVPAFLATIALAVSPVPLAIFFFGNQILPG
jgi:hypothetical protein